MQKDKDKVNDRELVHRINHTLSTPDAGEQTVVVQLNLIEHIKLTLFQNLKLWTM